MRQEPSECPKEQQGGINPTMPNSEVLYEGAPSTLTTLPWVSLSPSEQIGSKAGTIVQPRTCAKITKELQTGFDSLKTSTRHEH
jgi:hypothetical protein